MSQVWFDTITHWNPALKYMIETVGEDHVYLGSDYSFDMADFNCVERVRRVVPEGEARDKILGGNAQKLLKL